MHFSGICWFESLWRPSWRCCSKGWLPGCGISLCFLIPIAFLDFIFHHMILTGHKSLVKTSIIIYMRHAIRMLKGFVCDFNLLFFLLYLLIKYVFKHDHIPVEIFFFFCIFNTGLLVNQQCMLKSN